MLRVRPLEVHEEPERLHEILTVARAEKVSKMTR